MEENATWLIGKEALKAAKEGQGVLVENLVLLAKDNVSVKVNEEELTAEYLLEIFVKKRLQCCSHILYRKILQQWHLQ